MRARYRCLSRSTSPAVSRDRNFPEDHVSNKSFINKTLSVKMAGYLPRSLCENLWTSPMDLAMICPKSTAQLYLGCVTIANTTSLFPAWAAVSKHVRFCLLQAFKLAPCVNSMFTMVTWSCRQAMCNAVSPSMFTSSSGTLTFSSSWHAFTRLSFDAHINGVQWLLSLLHASAPSFSRMEQVFLNVG